MSTYSFISQDILHSADMDPAPLTTTEVDVATVTTPPDAQIVLTGVWHIALCQLGFLEVDVTIFGQSVELWRSEGWFNLPTRADL